MLSPTWVLIAVTAAFGATPIKVVETMTEHMSASIVRDALRPLAREWKTTEDAVLEALRTSFGERVRAPAKQSGGSPPARLALVGADDGYYDMG